MQINCTKLNTGNSSIYSWASFIMPVNKLLVFSCDNFKLQYIKI